MDSARLISDNLPQYAPVTGHYELSDGRYVLVSVYDTEPPANQAVAPIILAMRVRETLPAPTEIFLADESATVLDSDGDPANGMTPLLVCDGPLSVEDALAQLGYTLVS